MINYEEAQNIAWLPFDMPVINHDLICMANELKKIDNEYWYWCTFRNSYLCVLYGNQDVNNKTEMEWMPWAKRCSKIIGLTESFIFPQTNVKPRIIVIRTMPGMKMRVHTDCSPDEIHLFQPKLRLVVQGEDSCLYYVNEKDERVYIDPKHKSYLMSGSVKHGMDNVSKDEKYTICWGDPWNGDNLENELFHKNLNHMYQKYKNEGIFVNQLGDVDHILTVKDTSKEKIYSWNEWNENKEL